MDVAEPESPFSVPVSAAWVSSVAALLDVSAADSVVPDPPQAARLTVIPAHTITDTIFFNFISFLLFFLTCLL